MKPMLPALGLAAFAMATAIPAAAQDLPTANIDFLGTEGEPVGVATLTETGSGVLISIEVTGLPPSQWVGFHIHETGTCDHTDGHESAGAHYNPLEAEHGYFAEAGPHAGDMPNQYVPADGVLRAEVLNTFVTLDDGDTGILGRALMVHAGADDYESQPSGDAGDRLACAVIG